MKVPAFGLAEYAITECVRPLWREGARQVDLVLSLDVWNELMDEQRAWDAEHANPSATYDEPPIDTPKSAELSRRMRNARGEIAPCVVSWLVNPALPPKSFFLNGTQYPWPEVEA